MLSNPPNTFLRISILEKLTVPQIHFQPFPYILGSRAPSVVGSQTGRGGGGVQSGFQPKRPNLVTPPKRPGSVTGSIEGRLATSTPRGRSGERERQFMASSPLQVRHSFEPKNDFCLKDLK